MAACSSRDTPTCWRSIRTPTPSAPTRRKEFAPKYGAEVAAIPPSHHEPRLQRSRRYHTRVRRAIMGALIPRALAPLEPKSGNARRRGYWTAWKSARHDGRSSPNSRRAIPVEVIGDLLAMPACRPRPLRGWSLAIFGALEPVLTPRGRAAGETALADFNIYLETPDRGSPRATRRSRARCPHAPDRRAKVEPLSAIELAENCVFLLNAGHETTTNLIGNALRAVRALSGPAARG